MSNISERFKQRVHERVVELYGKPLPKEVSDRIVEEYECIADYKDYKIDELMLAISDIFKEVGLAAEDVYGGSYSGASFIGYLLDINCGINPLPPHYRCAHCKHSDFDVSETTRVGAELPEKICPVCGKSMIGEGFSIDPWFFYGSPEEIKSFIYSTLHDKLEDKLVAFNFFAYRVPTDKLAAVIDALKRVEGISNCKEFFDELRKAHGVETPNKFEWQMRFDEDIELFLWNTPRTDLLSKLAALSGVHPGAIPIGNSPNTQAIREAFSKKHIFNIPVNAQTLKEFIQQDAPFLGIEEMEFLFRRLELLFKQKDDMLTYFKPKCFYDLVRCIAIHLGEGSWKDLLRSKPTELPACCEDVFELLKEADFDRTTAFAYTRQIQKGEGLTAEQESELRSHGLPSWFIEQCKTIRSLDTKSAAISMAFAAWRLLYYRFCVVDKETFYQTFIDAYHYNDTK